MDKMDKPRLAEVLGVEVGELFTICNKGGTTCELCVNEAGNLLNIETGVANNVDWLVFAINHPESIIRAPRLTEREASIMKDVGARWVSQDDGGTKIVELWDTKPRKTSSGCYFIPGGESVASIRKEIFPTVGPGECVELKEVQIS